MWQLDGGREKLSTNRAVELYHLTSDPGERIDLSTTNARPDPRGSAIKKALPTSRYRLWGTFPKLSFGMSKVYSFGWIGLTTILVAWATALVALSSASELESIDGCVIVPTQWSDGDSFLVRLPDKREIVVRLYFVDCIEVDVADITGKRRLREQARYFGVEDLIAVRNFGTEATRFVAETLSQPFRLHTAFANALGRSGKPRIYAFVTTPEGRDLGELLVEKGLARAHGQKRKTPDGTHRDDWNAQLSDVELVAAVRGAGVWAQSDPAKIVAMRRVEREEQRALVLIVDGPPSDPPEEPIDVNSASLNGSS